MKGLKHLKNYVVADRDYKKIAIVLPFIGLFGLFFSVVLFPIVGFHVVKWQYRLTPWSPLRRMYTQIPFPMTFKIYLFNVLNKHGVLMGEKPNFQEIGPYIFHEYYYKYNLSDNKIDDTLNFTLRRTWIFQPQLSNGLTGDENITMIHPVMALMGLAANVDRKSMLPLVKIAIDEIFHNPKEIWWHGRAMDLMFNGIPIDCTSQKPQARVVCMVFRSGELQAIEKIDRTHFKFSLLGGYNHTDSGKFEVNRGKRNARHIGRIVAVDGKRQLDVWNGQSCNEIRGTDGLVFPPFLKKSSHIWFFQKLVCRSFVMKFEKSGIKLTGIPVDKFSFDFGDIPGNKSQSCFCRKDGKCPFKGTMDLFPCLGAPMTLSLPHFYKADPVLLEAMGVGLKPNPKEHETFINFELLSGVPLSAAKRIQFNFELEPIEEIPIMRNLPKVIFPFLWIEEGAVVPGLYVKLLKYSLILLRRVNWGIFVGSLIGAPCAAIASFVLHLLIKYKYIEVLNKTIGSAFKKVQTKVVEAVEFVVEGTEDDESVKHPWAHVNRNVSAMKHETRMNGNGSIN